MTTKKRTLTSLLLLIITIGLIIVAGCTTPQQKSTNTYLSAIGEPSPPISYLENGTVRGTGVDILRELSKSSGYPILDENIRINPWNEAYQTALSNENIILIGTVRLPERENLFQWVGPFAKDEYVLFAKRGRTIDISSEQDITRYRVGVVTDDAAVDHLKALGLPQGQTVSYPDTASAIRALEKGSIDLWCYLRQSGEYLARQETGRYGSVSVVYVLNSSDMYYAFSLGTSPEVVKKYQTALEAAQIPPREWDLSTIGRINADYLPTLGLATIRYYTEEFPPLNYMENGEQKGIALDLLDEILSYYGIPLTGRDVRLVPWPEGYNATMTGPRTALFSTVRTPERESLFKWAGPIVKTNNAIFSLRNKNISFQDTDVLMRMRIGTIANTASETFLPQIGIPHESIIKGNDNADMVSMLENGRIDAWATGELAGRSYLNSVAKDSTQYEVVYRFPTQEFYYAFSKDTPDSLIRAFQAAIEAIKYEKDEDGVSEYERILYSHIGVSCTLSEVTEEDVLSLVNYTVRAMERDAYRTLSRINAGEHPFWDKNRRELFVFVYDQNVTLIGRADNPYLVGTSMREKTDAAGSPFHDQIVEGSLSSGTGWVEHLYTHPVEPGIFYKKDYYQLVKGNDGSNYVVGAGMYRTC
jgi:polar amino acid transport system substrate-binding protein